ncbi:Rieske 2Fe-2S domain-containing protein [Pyxidicoccus sp. MSG2]|uniref:Rieske 2Fe-2S domain-containing protein n=1 Tax=Pyxidicoccus sp. MSG2 TaxID=2996790 RepID=UPI00226E0E6E|nr:Rieske 2Fe-2S domain-containing protein [Pyxidicoccus sp. MSG2]MCY1014424.1 Rieske 2Fe-2S domain-containing protein [Pyxidicoccus sp. MSG2]
MSRRYPFPSYPNGWFAVGLSGDLPAGGSLTCRAFGQELVLFRTEAGAAFALDAYCPHLGAHLGRGGRVCGDSFRCPLHGFRYDGQGHCVGTSQGGPAVAGLRIGTWPLRERNGLLLVWHHAEGRPPQWEVPVLDAAEWSAMRVERVDVRTHPQEVTENSIDLTHFSELHGYEAVRVVDPPSLDGPCLRAAFASSRSVESLGTAGRAEFVFRVEVWGLGYVCVEAVDSVFGVRSRQFALATPLDDERVTLRLAASIVRFADPALTERILGLFFRGFISDLRQDIPIWENKRYVEAPALTRAEGILGAYRHWARQFYSAPGDAAATA